ncbi:MAG TPA: AAA family ATPase [Kofleriaceae bacterium]|nr:AAA family ATPase [Kofleriaceae bacterium]
MRILAIRGADLASLAGRFEVALDSEPLAGAGLFAIVGETGAGKTTLLDAMCAALFDKTPRLEGHSGFKVGRGDDRQRLGANDVRALVRNGAGGGWAEVDFEGKDRRRYRARWEVQRARKKLDGNWQDQRMKLVRLDDGKALGGTKSEVLAEIRRALGLSYDEFCRSALLAQFQFARFLRASGSERAELLERMTGTHVYGAVSTAAFRKAAWYAGERKRTAETAAAVTVLDDAARAEVVAGEAAAQAALAHGRALGAALAAAGQWRARAATLTAELAAGDAEVADAEAARAAGASLAAEVAAVEGVAAVRAPWDARARALARHRGAAAQVAALAAEADGAALVEREAAAAAEATAATVAEVAARAQALAPELARARTLDVQIAEAERAARTAAAEAERAAAATRDAEAVAGAAAAAVATAGAQVVAHEAWLAAHAGRAVLAGDWPRWRALFDRLVAARAARDAARAEVDRLTPGVSAAEAARAAADAALARAVAAHQQAKAIADAAEERARAAPLKPAERALAAAEERARRVAAVAAVVAAARQAAADELQLRGEQAAAEAAVAAAAAAEERARAALARADAALDEATATLDRLRRALGHAGERAELHAGEPCPVCGATEHPWAGAVVDGLVAEQAARIATLRDGAARERRALHDAQVGGRVAAERVAARAEALAALAARAPARVAAWRDGLAALGELPLAGDPAGDDARAWVAEVERAATAGLARARDARDAAAALAATAAAAQSAVLTAADAVEQARVSRDQRRDAAFALAGARADAARAVTVHGDAAAVARDELAAALAGPADLRALDDDAPGLRDRLAAEVATWRARADERERLRAELVDRRPAAAAARARAAELTRVAAERGAAAAAHQSALAALLVERTPLLDGRPVAVVEASLQAAEASARAAAARAAAAAATARERRADVTARHAAAIAQTEAAAAELATSAAAVAAALAAAGLDEATAAPLLARDPAWLAGARATLTALDHGCARARAVAAERRRLVAAHDATRPAVVDALAAAGAPAPAAILDEPDPAFAARAAAADQLGATAAATLASCEAARRADDDARARRDALTAALADLDAAARPYEQLADLIGSADGKILRNFAQSLSLDALLGAANAHLDRLAPRYQIERVAGLDLELQVIDREMGYDVRAVTSLSGGESFLVSLALALGLSSLTAADVEVKTLFIDEGFGSLDPATLDAALSVLDALRASGRQVGIVSHVAELEERVAAAVAIRPVGGGRSVVEIKSARG